MLINLIHLFAHVNSIASMLFFLEEPSLPDHF